MVLSLIVLEKLIIFLTKKLIKCYINLKLNILIISPTTINYNHLILIIEVILTKKKEKKNEKKKKKKNQETEKLFSIE